MKKLKIISSIFLTTILATSVVLAFIDLGTVNSSDSLTSSLWNELVGKINDNGNKLNEITSVGGNIGIGETNPSSKLEINGDLTITGTGGSVIISVEVWNEMQKNINKTGYRFWTHNSTDFGHYWDSDGTNFRNCEIMEYFQAGETIQNTYISSILSTNLGVNRIDWPTSPNHDMFLRDFAHNGYSTVNSNYGSWATVIYGPSKLFNCAVD